MTSAATAQIKTLGILTGGGDCPGINAVIRAVAKTAILQHGIRVLGVEDGFLGLVENRVRDLSIADVSGILLRGGTILGANNRCNPQRYATGRNPDGSPIFENVSQRCLDTIAHHHMDALVLIGGDGTMSCAEPLLKAGIQCVGIPKTIDNDIIGTEVTFGFSSAVSMAARCLDNLMTTADSHRRVMVCEIMGRNAGWLTLHSGIAAGAEVILIPEMPFDLDVISEFVVTRSKGRAGFSVIACAEGARQKGGTVVVDRTDPTSPDPLRLGGIGRRVAEMIEQKTGLECRATVLGHVLRGGTPVAFDRVLATALGVRAIECLMEGRTQRLVVVQNGVMADAPMQIAVNKQRLVPLDHGLLRAARAIGTCLGV